ncbi:ABC transporter ATP-binding protein [Kitasatospora sp. LaBMicrA B282]|uniref:ABC transporter ATP-binding protein n=1 Tax=Kitasatospora sp. LaBMicrA B282 TaxID=3420949 RepID=UPI003D129944
MTTLHSTRAPARSRTTAVLAEDLVKTYPGKGKAPAVRALDGLGIEVEAGTVFGLLGPNGAGKSTTIKILTTLATADSGRALVAGLDVARDPAAVRRAIGVVAQRSGADPVATGRENLRLQGRLYGLRGRALEGRVDELLRRFDLVGPADRPVRGYSGGMQRRLDVALGLVHRPQVLFLDEPTTGLDPEARTAMWEEIDRLAAGEGLTVLLTTHYLDEADRLAARLAIVDRGRVVAAGTPDELKGQLRGDAVQVELPAAPGADEPLVYAALGQVPGVGEVAVHGRTVIARAADGAAAVPAVLAALDRCGHPAVAVRLARPSLDDVYLRHTGRSFAQADHTAAPEGAVR